MIKDMKVSGRMEKKTVKEIFIFQIILNIKAIGRMINHMVLEFKNLKMEKYIKVSGKTV